MCPCWIIVHIKGCKCEENNVRFHNLYIEISTSLKSREMGNYFSCLPSFAYPKKKKKILMIGNTFLSLSSPRFAVIHSKIIQVELNVRDHAAVCKKSFRKPCFNPQLILKKTSFTVNEYFSMINYNDLTLKLFFISYYDFIRYLG